MGQTFHEGGNVSKSFTKETKEGCGRGRPSMNVRYERRDLKGVPVKELPESGGLLVFLLGGGTNTRGRSTMLQDNDSEKTGLRDLTGVGLQVFSQKREGEGVGEKRGKLWGGRSKSLPPNDQLRAATAAHL